MCVFVCGLDVYRWKVHKNVKRRACVFSFSRSQDGHTLFARPDGGAHTNKKRRVYAAWTFARCS